MYLTELSCGQHRQQHVGSAKQDYFVFLKTLTVWTRNTHAVTGTAGLTIALRLT